MVQESKSKNNKVNLNKSKPGKDIKSPKLHSESNSQKTNINNSKKLCKFNSVNTKSNKSQLQEIDNLFENIATKKLEKKEESLNEVHKDKEALKESKKQKKLTNSDGDNLVYGQIKSAYDNFIISPEAPLERIDAESGLPVYKGILIN